MSVYCHPSTLPTAWHSQTKKKVFLYPVRPTSPTDSSRDDQVGCYLSHSILPYLMYGTLAPCRYTREMMRRRRHTLNADWPDRWFPIFRNIETHAGSALAANSVPVPIRRLLCRPVSTGIQLRCPSHPIVIEWHSPALRGSPSKESTEHEGGCTKEPSLDANGRWFCLGPLC